MRIDNSIELALDEAVKKYYDEKQKMREPSGKLSASILGWPLQWQVLKYLGVGQREVEPYVLKKFIRGEHVEEFVVRNMKGVLETQKQVEYRKVIGYVDALVDSKEYMYRNGLIPHEIKSVTNAKYSRINKDKTADPQHKLQAGLYALALGLDHYAIDYVASDDYRVTTYLFDTVEVKGEIDRIIDEYDEAIKNKVIPEFNPRYAWQESSQYSSFPEFMDKDEVGIRALLKSYGVGWK